MQADATCYFSQDTQQTSASQAFIGLRSIRETKYLTLANLLTVSNDADIQHAADFITRRISLRKHWA